MQGEETDVLGMQWGGLDAWTRATGLPVPRPPGPPEGWTHVLDVLGPYRVMARAPVAVPVLDQGTLVAWLRALGRPVHGVEQRAYLLVSPVPRHPDPEGVLLQLLGHGDPGVRGGAARLLGTGRHPRAAAALLRGLAGPTEEERAETMRALGAVGDADAVEAVLNGEGSPALDGHRLGALAALAERLGWGVLDAQLEGPGRARALLRAVVSGDEATVVSSLRGGDEGLRHGVGACVAARPALAARMASELLDALVAQPGVDSQHGLIRALGAGGEEGVERLGELLHHPAWEVRTASAMALGQAGPAAAGVDAALRRALSDADADVQREAALARQLAGREPAAMAARLARRVGRTHGFLERVRRSGGSLGPFDAVLYDTPPTLELLARLTTPHDPDVLAVSALWLGARLGAMAGPTLGAMAADHQRRVPLLLRRASAAGGLVSGSAPSEGVVQRLLLAHDPQRAGLGLDGSGLRPHAGELAALALGDPDAVVRWAAVQALRGLGEGAAPFGAVLDRVAETDPSEAVRDEARHGQPVPFRQGGHPQHVAAVLHPQLDAAGRGGPALLALASRAPEVAFDLAMGLLDHDLRPLAVSAAKVVGQVAAQSPDLAGAWCREGLRRLQDPGWACREVGAWLLAGLAEAPVAEALREEAVEALEASASADPDDDVRRAAAAAAAIWRRG